MKQKKYVRFLCLIVLLLIIDTLCISHVCAQDEPQLTIELYDSTNWNESAGTVVVKGRSYDIIVGTEEEPSVLNVTVSVLGATYLTSTELPYITIPAPLFNQSESFVINATKEGYLPAQLEITVVKGMLTIVADRNIVEEKKEFLVTVKDQDNTPVENALVYAFSDANPVITDIHGVAYVDAPDVQKDTTVTIQATKQGYMPGTVKIRVDNAEGFGLDFTGIQFLQILPVLLAVLVVIFAIVFVLWRQRKSTQMPRKVTRSEEPSHEPLSYTQGRQGQSLKHEATLFSVETKKEVSVSAPTSKVEEIRIPAQEKKKETTYLSKEKQQEQPVLKKGEEQDEWFKGQNYMRYKLDELTGKIDQNTDGKWFEGERDNKYKVDETLKKNVKKKKDDEEDVK